MKSVRGDGATGITGEIGPPIYTDLCENDDVAKFFII